MVDVSGKEVQVGDTVAFCVTKYSSLEVGTVEKITPKGIIVMHTPPYGMSRTAKRLARHSSQFSKVD